MRRVYTKTKILVFINVMMVIFLINAIMFSLTSPLDRTLTFQFGSLSLSLIAFFSFSPFLFYLILPGLESLLRVTCAVTSVAFFVFISNYLYQFGFMRGYWYGCNGTLHEKLSEAAMNNVTHKRYAASTEVLQNKTGDGLYVIELTYIPYGR